MLTAYSRQTPDTKVYVQHKIREHGPMLADLIVNQGAKIYVSGRAQNMPKSVEKAFIEIVQTKLQTDQPQTQDAELGSKFVSTMHKDGRYFKEVW